MILNKEIYINHKDIEVVVNIEEVRYYPGEYQTHDHPGCEAEVEVTSFEVYEDNDEGIKFSDEKADEIFTENEDYILQELLEYVNDRLMAEEEDAADRRYEMIGEFDQQYY